MDRWMEPGNKRTQLVSLSLYLKKVLLTHEKLPDLFDQISQLVVGALGVFPACQSFVQGCLSFALGLLCLALDLHHLRTPVPKSEPVAGALKQRKKITDRS